MQRRVITADDLRAARAGGLTELRVPLNALVTPFAVDTAKDFGIAILREAAGASASAGGPAQTAGVPTPAVSASPSVCDASDCLPDIREQDLFTLIPVKNPKDAEFLARLKNAGPARICLDRAGPRYKTKALLRFKADHAAAVDAAFTEVSDEFLKRMALPAFSTGSGQLSPLRSRRWGAVLVKATPFGRDRRRHERRRSQPTGRRRRL